jgi:hypothetical protein
LRYPYSHPLPLIAYTKFFKDFFNDDGNAPEVAAEPEPEPVSAPVDGAKQSKKQLKQNKFKKRKNEYDSEDSGANDLEADADEGDHAAPSPANLLQLVQASEKKFSGQGNKRKKSK